MMIALLPTLGQLGPPRDARLERPPQRTLGQLRTSLDARSEGSLSARKLSNPKTNTKEFENLEEDF